jgi:P-loop ATPase
MWLDNASDIDILFYEPYARIISDIAKNKEYNPLTIGVFGLWGAGKSTLLSLIDNKLKDEEKIICVTINAWMFETYGDAKTAIMEALLQELKEKAPSEKVRKNLGNLIKSVDWFKLGTKAVSKIAPLVASVVSGNPLPMLLNVTGSAEEIGNTVKNAADSIQSLKDEYWKDYGSVTDNSAVNTIRKFRKEFSASLEDDGIENVVIMIDDLDRCSPERIIEILEVIKLFLAVERTTFIIAADENVIKYAIRGKYPPMNGFDVELDKEYIEKIIQLPIYIPELSAKDIQNYLILLVAQSFLTKDSFDKLLKEIFDKKMTVSGDVISLVQLNKLIEELDLTWKLDGDTEHKKISVIIDEIREIVAYTLKGNPRQAKRFLNTFITKRKLAQIYYGEELSMEILAKLLVLQKIDNDLFIQLNEWNKEFGTENRKFKEMRDAVEKSDGKGYEPWLNPQVKKWLNCKPKDLENQLLDKYFYLTRENLNQRDIDFSSFSSNTKYVLERIGNAKSGLMSSIIEEAKALNSEEIKDVLNVVVSKIEKGELKYFVIRDFYIHFESYRDKIANALAKSNNVIGPSEMAALRTMYQTDSKNLETAFVEMKSKGTMNQKVLSDIKKKEA